MRVRDFIVLAIILLLLFAALRSMRKRTGCGGNCAECNKQSCITKDGNCGEEKSNGKKDD